MRMMSEGTAGTSRLRGQSSLEVFLPIPVWHPYTYSVDSSQLPKDVRGCRVLVPLRRGLAVGFALGITTSEQMEVLKPIEEFLDQEPKITADLFELAMWISNYYLCPPGMALESLFPGPAKHRVVRRLVLLPRSTGTLPSDAPVEASRCLDFMRNHEGASVQSIKQGLGGGASTTAIEWLLREGFVRWLFEVRGSGRKKTHNVATLSGDPDTTSRLSPAGNRLVETLRMTGGSMPVPTLLRAASVSRSALGTLMKKAIIKIRPEEAGPRLPSFLPDGSCGDIPELSARQLSVASEVIEIVRARQFESFLLKGVTGSGKTEVYGAVAEVALDLRLSVICLVPEITLSTQIVSRFRSRFGNKVVLLHSGLSPGERYDAWLMIGEKEPIFVVGPRSAVFSPVRNLGLVIVDEEHEPSYKQDQQPRYNARDVAIMRAKMSGCPVILGSATPSLESFNRALSGKFKLLTLEDRAKRLPMPSVTVVDMKAEPPQPGRTIFSSLLQVKLKETIRQKKQALLLLNRRGFSRSLQCIDCGHIPTCPDCEISLTFHRGARRIVCHYCNLAEEAPGVCSSCGSHRLSHGGLGTERLEAEVKTLFPGVSVTRMDSDTTRSKGSHVKILSKMMQGEAQILVGTQMIAKGLDLPNVTLVGVVSADTPLQLPDFRSSERAFQLLTQVAGRAGRSKVGGEVVLQSYIVNYPALLCAARHDYERFAREELADRRQAGYPPFSYLARIVLRSGENKSLEVQAANLAGYLREYAPGDGGRLLGPAPPMMRRIRGQNRLHFLVFHKSRPLLHSWLREVLSHIGEGFPGHGVHMMIDVDPLDTA